MAEEAIAVPAAQVTVATPEIAAPAEVTATPAVEATPEVKPEKTFRQDEVDRLIRDRLERANRKHERETEELRQIALRTQPAKVEPTAPTDAAPKQEDFTDYEQFILAKATHVAKEAVRTEREAADKLQREQATQREQQTVHQAHSAREQAASSSKYSDYYDVTRNPSLPITDAMANVIALSEDGPDIAYFLGKNPAETERIAKLHPQLVAKELGIIAGKLAATPPTVTLSSAPAPITPVSGKAAPVASSEPSDKDDMATWVKKREAQLRRRQKA